VVVHAAVEDRGKSAKLDQPDMKSVVKSCARALALIAILPALGSFHLRSALMGRDRALEGSSQWLGLIPGMLGEYLRRAFLARVLSECAPTATIGFGVLFSRAGARIGDQVYIGPRCHIGLAHIERDVLLAAGVHVPSGGRTHGTDDESQAIRDQETTYTVVRIGEGTWIGSAAVVMADVGAHTVIGAGAVVTKPVASWVVAAGVPARVVRARRSGSSETAEVERHLAGEDASTNAFEDLRPARARDVSQ
jgi:virginiamycin A acetyltransferase